MRDNGPTDIAKETLFERSCDDDDNKGTWRDEHTSPKESITSKNTVWYGWYPRIHTRHLSKTAMTQERKRGSLVSQVYM